MAPSHLTLAYDHSCFHWSQTGRADPHQRNPVPAALIPVEPGLEVPAVVAVQTAVQNMRFAGQVRAKTAAVDRAAARPAVFR